MNYIINDASFNINSVFIAQGLELKTEFYLNQLKLLKMFYDADRYSAVKQILKKINQFMHKYIEDERASSIAKMNLAKERRSLEQETDFICEEINYFKKNSLIDYEIHKIRDVVIKLYDFEESAYRIIEDISKDIGYNKKISIKQMLWEMA